MEEKLEADQLKKLRDAGKINKDEVAIRVDDILIAENVITRNRRIIEYSYTSLEESSKRVLKG